MKKIMTFFILLSLLVMISCAATTSSRYREGDNVGQEAALTVEDERRLTQEALPNMLKDYPPADNKELQQYISNLGMKIVKANNLEGNPYHYTFSVVDVPHVNAFALPAGTVFVTAPLIAMTANEAELAGVVSHEIGHVIARHTAERMFVMEKEQNKTWLYTVGGGLIGVVAGYGLGKVLCPEGDAECLAKAAMLGGAAGAGGGLLVQKYKFMGNSREDEMEADRIGFRLAVGAGYDKDQVGKFYERLLEMEKKAQKSGNPIIRSLLDAMSTHPPSEERVQQMNELAKSSPTTARAITNSPDFKRAKQTAAGYVKK
ncbi:MAG: M48 family metalloprotease [Deltaproteobacteria bacterium]|nr:M48 family metalloprotease [Deltaproteobacteria bacterium]